MIDGALETKGLELLYYASPGKRSHRIHFTNANSALNFNRLAKDKMQLAVVFSRGGKHFNYHLSPAIIQLASSSPVTPPLPRHFMTSQI